MTVNQRHLPARRLSGMLGQRAGEQAAYSWLSEGIRQLVVNGRVLHGTMLPSERELVAELGMSRTTITRAYQELRERGFAEARQGSGTRIRIPGGEIGGGAEPLAVGVQETLPPGGIDLTCGAPTAPLGLASYYQRALDQLPGYIGGMGYYPLGLPLLREAIAEDYARRGLPTGPEQIIVTAGALSGVATAARTVLARSARVLAESPSYPNSVNSLRQHGARMLAMPIGPEGSDVAGIEAALARGGIGAMLCLPDFHNPTGTLLENEGRERWARALARHGVQGIIDETNAELWLDERPPVFPMAKFGENLITVGSASKTYWGGLRLGWIRAPRALVGAINQVRATIDLGAPVLEQLVLSMLITERAGLDEPTRASLRASRDWLHGSLGAELPEWKIQKPGGGMSLWCNLPAPRSAALAAQARKAGLVLSPGATFAVQDHGLDHWLRVPYALDGESLARAVPQLVEAWKTVA
ncbi:GntR family transcriptional regulator [Arthrobacter sp. MYb229]|uniref:MocR-like transcription factor YczR n=1 Tax=unclassified Arthrobacter TaxID=235627 RepID=UPI000CFCE379|nr:MULTISPECIES: PLP-dependent aminotransferase family protein [unclassified Arthrobacter]PRA04019.1 GntR family transcriptional regulator [Arthrobacter sp. MYb229]PRB52069.1 GntR family transcriptional regulator [Arthrobacter sp. MYb216]